MELETAEYFQRIFNRLRDPQIKKNTKLGDALGFIDFYNDTFTLKYITFGTLTGQAEIQSKKDPALPGDIPGLADRVSFEFLDEARLNEELRNAYAVVTGISEESWELVAAGAQGKRSDIIEIEAGDYRTCLLVVAASQIINLYKRFRDSLFTINIRNYIGNTATNKSIINTARNIADRFFYYNNGISCLATKLEVLKDRVKVHGLQVINGAQTVKSLFRAGGKDLDSPWKSKLDEPLVLVRITEVTKGYGEEGRFGNEVIRYNNTQNVIKVSDFRSNDPIQEDLKMQFGRIKRFGKTVEYMPKRGEKTKANAELIRLEEFTKVIYSFLRDPVSFSGSTSFLFDDSDAGGYRYVFGDGTQGWLKMPEEEFKLRSSIWWLGKAFGEQLAEDKKKTDLEPIARAALERKWMLIHVARLLMERTFGEQGYRSLLAKYYKGEWEMGNGPLGQWFADLYENSKGVVTFVYTWDARNKKDFVHRNWMRNENTVRELQSYVEANPSKLPPIPSAKQ